MVPNSRLYFSVEFETTVPKLMGGSSAAPSGRSLCELRIRSSFLPRPLATPSSFLVYLFSLLVPLVFLSSGGVPIVGAFEIGDSVWYFHREDRDKDVANVFVALEDHSHGNFRPRFGLSEGWLPGQIVNMSAEGVVKGGEGNEQYGYGADGSLTSVDCEDRDAEGRCLSKKKEWFLIRTSWSLWGANSGRVFFLWVSGEVVVLRKILHLQGVEPQHLGDGGSC